MTYMFHGSAYDHHSKNFPLNLWKYTWLSKRGISCLSIFFFFTVSRAPSADNHCYQWYNKKRLLTKMPPRPYFMFKTKDRATVAALYNHQSACTVSGEQWHLIALIHVCPSLSNAQCASTFSIFLLGCGNIFELWDIHVLLFTSTV